jgi:adenylate cyclase, class 2
MNYEIEMKAHVYNRQEVIDILNKIAVYGGHTQKNDTYYRLQKQFSQNSNQENQDNFQNYVTARIRQEKLTLDGKTSTKFYFTYKRKELKKSSDGKEIEVNEENEFTFDDDSALTLFFQDAGAQISLKKQKSVEQWNFFVDGENAHIELCTVPPLGDFLEIEIIKSENDAQIVKKCRNIIQKIFTECNIPLNQIEERYYRDMLKGI